MKHAQLALIGALILAAGCRYDPVQQDVIDSLGDDGRREDELHRAGQPCLACHSAYEGATPFVVAGTVFSMDPKCKKLVPKKGVEITIFDSAGKKRTLPRKTNAVGNFYVEVGVDDDGVDWSDLVYPISPSIAYLVQPQKPDSPEQVEQVVLMQSLVGRDGSCASCHKSPERKSPDILDEVTGAGRDSAGVILAGRGCP